MRRGPADHPDRHLAGPDRGQGREGSRLNRARAFRSFCLGSVLAAAGPAHALAADPPLTAERAIEIEQQGVREAVGTAPCRREGGSDDIVVCGRRGPDPNRVPFPDQRAAGDRVRMLPGELPRAQPSYDTCMFGCQQPVTITDRHVRKYGGRILRKVLGRD